MTKLRKYSLLPLLPLLSAPILLTARLSIPAGVKPDERVPVGHEAP